MDPTILIAHGLLAYAILIEPWFGVRLYRGLDRDREDPGARLRMYNRLLAAEWLWMPFIALAVWTRPDPLGTVGVSWPVIEGWGAGLVWGVSLIVAVQTVAIVFLRDRIRKDPKQLAALDHVRLMLPRSTRERWRWVAVSVTAGVCEEFLYRGFLFFYFQEVLGASLVVALLASSIIFGLAHIYQGIKAGATTALVAVVMGGIYAVSGSLLVPIVLHAIMDLRSLLFSDLVDLEPVPQV